MKSVIRSTLAVVVLAMAGCAGTPGKGVPLEERAAARWEAVLAGEWGRAYEFLSPGYRATVTPQAYEIAARARTVRWKAARFQELRECEESYCKVAMVIDFEARTRVRGAGNLTVPQIIEEHWIMRDGVWYFVPDAVL